MNIFYLDSVPEEAAAFHCDKHVVKMIVESCQLMSTAHRVLDGSPKWKYVMPKLSISPLEPGDGEAFLTVKSKLRMEHPDPHFENTLYKETHQNHPCAVWARTSWYNYVWLHRLAFFLAKEYTDRYGKIHKCEGSGLINLLSKPPDKIRKGPFTPPALAMPEEYQVPGDPVESYRNYYRKGKNNIAQWRTGDVPIWF